MNHQTFFTHTIMVWLILQTHLSVFIWLPPATGILWWLTLMQIFAQVHINFDYHVLPLTRNWLKSRESHYPKCVLWKGLKRRYKATEGKHFFSDIWSLVTSFLSEIKPEVPPQKHSFSICGTVGYLSPHGPKESGLVLYGLELKFQVLLDTHAFS